MKNIFLLPPENILQVGPLLRAGLLNRHGVGLQQLVHVLFVHLEV